MPKAAAIYTRISDDRLDDELGVKRQIKDCHTLAGRKKWEVAIVRRRERTKEPKDRIAEPGIRSSGGG
jgi:DNA invertase Pin-like site-specific DNA recombinase